MDCKRLINYIREYYSLELTGSLKLYYESKDDSFKQGIENVIFSLTNKSISDLKILSLEWNGEKINKNNNILVLKDKIEELTIINNELRENYWNLKQSIFKSKKSAINFR